MSMRPCSFLFFKTFRFSSPGWPRSCEPWFKCLQARGLPRPRPLLPSSLSTLSCKLTNVLWGEPGVRVQATIISLSLFTLGLWSLNLCLFFNAFKFMPLFLLMLLDNGSCNRPNFPVFVDKQVSPQQFFHYWWWQKSAWSSCLSSFVLGWSAGLVWSFWISIKFVNT